MPDLTSLVDELLAGSDVAADAASGAVRPAPAPRVPVLAHSSRLRSPQVVGRDAVLDAVRRTWRGTAPAHVALEGEAGLGKSRLLAELAHEAEAGGEVVVRGRGLAHHRGVPFRPVAELATALAERADLPAEVLHAHRAALSVLVPGRGDATATEPVPTFAATEAIAALAAATGRRTLLVVDDVQWADAESLDVLSALVRRSSGAGVRLLLAARSGEADEALGVLEQEGSLTRWQLGPLEAGASAALCEAVLGGRLPPAVSQAVELRAEGVPLVVEELVNDLVLRGALARTDGGAYELRDATAADALPRSHRASVRARLGTLDPATLDVVRVAALLGRELASSRVREFVDVEPAALRDSLALLVDRQVLERLDGAEADHRFVHALTREAVLAELSGPELAGLAARVLDRGDTATGAEQRADLALIAGRPQVAVELLREASRESRQQGGLASAERQLRRAVGVRGADAGEATVDLVEVLALAGRTEAALAAGGTTTERPGRLHLALARVHETRAEPDLASGRLARAEAAGATGADLELVRARVLLAQRGLEDGQQAALAALRAHASAEQACEALELLARCARTRDESEAEQLLQRMSALAEQHGLGSWRFRALSELGTLDLFRLGKGDRLRAARELAEAAGDLVTATVVGYHEVIRRFHAVELEGWEAWIDDVQSAARAYRLEELDGALTLLRAAYLLLDGRRPEAHDHVAAVDEAALDPDRVASLWGVVRTVDALLVDDPAAARAAVGRGVDAVRGREFGDPSPMWGTWALLAALDGDGAPAAADVRARGTTVNRVNAGLVRWADAVVLGAASRADEAREAASEAVALLAPAPFYAAVALRHVLPVARRQGWAPAEADVPLPGALRSSALARALDDLTGGTRPAGDLTARERDVLGGVRRGLTNAEIAADLVISVRTVEKHVERLLAKTGTSNRTQLALLDG